MGERAETVLGIGCPSSDIARDLDRTLAANIVNTKGGGVLIDVSKPFLLVVFHPTTTQYGSEREEMEELLAALEDVHIQTLLLWPNIDAGSDHISKTIRLFRDHKRPDWLRTLTNLSPEDYLKVLANTACAIGNSSSFVRDASYFGTPVVLVGNRQDGREADVHVMRVAPTAEEMAETIWLQLQHGRYVPSTLHYTEMGMCPSALPMRLPL
jgi:UDP-N-acetylglucosamine 2-epimerase